MFVTKKIAAVNNAIKIIDTLKAFALA